MSLFHNPGLLKPEVLIRQFVARGEQLDELVEELRHERPGHQLCIGQRGMGKTTLLCRVAVEVARDADLAARWLALTFPEEQYNVAALSDFWLNCLDAAADALHDRGEGAAATELDQFVAGLPTEEAARTTLALDRLQQLTRGGRGLLLCIDNLQQVLGRLTPTEQWALRDALGGDTPLVVFAASPVLPADTQAYEAPFYDFFQLTRLDALDFDATLAMLHALARQAEREDVSAALAAAPARLRALHTFTGGNPRTVALLFDVLLADPNEGVQTALEALVDRATPLYKARFEELADQAQVVFGALALAWQPVTAAQLAESTRLEVNTVSTQLTRLHRDGLVLKVEIPGQARTGFLVAERFFCLWYLMRASRRLRGRMLGLARALEALYSPELLEQFARRSAREAGNAEWLAALAQVAPGEGIRRALWARIPSEATPELVCEPDGLAFVDRRERRKAWFAERMAWVAGLDCAARGVSMEAATFVALAVRPEDLGGGGDDDFWAFVRTVDGPEWARMRKAVSLAASLGIDPEASKEDAEAASLACQYPGFVLLWGRAGRPHRAEAVIAAGDPCIAITLSRTSDDPVRVLDWCLDHGAASALISFGVLQEALKLGLPEVALRAWHTSQDHPALPAPTPSPAPPSVEPAEWAAAEVARLLAKHHPALAVDVAPLLAKPEERAVVLWRMAAAVCPHPEALRRLAERARASDTPYVPEAIEIFLARDPRLLGAFAPEYQAGIRLVLKDLWPDFEAESKKAPPKARRTTRPPRRP